MDIRAAPLLMPVMSWLPLAAAVVAAQSLAVAWCIRPSRRQMAISLGMLLAADVLLVVLLRVCVAQMGRMDYSESFPRWRWHFLTLVLIAAGLPLPLWVLALKVAFAGRSRGPAGASAIHPIFRSALVAWLLTAAVIVLAGGEFSFIPRSARITPLEVRLTGLPAQLDGLRIAVLADHHIGPLMTPARARQRLQSLTAARPDLVVDLGDITEIDASYQPEAARIVGECAAPLGTFAVAGNFDVRCGTDSLREELRKVGVTYLENEVRRITRDGAELWLVGLGDPWTGWADLDTALTGVPEGATVIVLAHSPDVIEEAAARRVPLVLSGHLHGGQVVIPFAGPVVGMSEFGTRFAWGHFRVGDTRLIVSRGLGEEGVPLRLFCPPEVVVVTLRCSND